MNIIFNATCYMNRGYFKPVTAARLFQKVWEWAENFERMTGNDPHIKIESITVEKKNDDVFNDFLIITIRGNAYGLDLEEEMHFHTKEILRPKKGKETFEEFLTKCLIEKFKRIQECLGAQHFSINKTLTEFANK